MASVPTRAAFLASVPGSMFNSAPVTAIDAALVDAAEQTNEKLFASTARADYHVFLKAAIALLRLPGSIKMRLANPNQEYTWERELMGVQRVATLGKRVF